LLSWSNEISLPLLWSNTAPLFNMIGPWWLLNALFNLYSTSDCSVTRLSFLCCTDFTVLKTMHIVIIIIKRQTPITI
jgi:hypothetical protein